MAQRNEQQGVCIDPWPRNVPAPSAERRARTRARARLLDPPAPAASFSPPRHLPLGANNASLHRPRPSSPSPPSRAPAQQPAARDWPARYHAISREEGRRRRQPAPARALRPRLGVRQHRVPRGRHLHRLPGAERPLDRQLARGDRAPQEGAAAPARGHQLDRPRAALDERPAQLRSLQEEHAGRHRGDALPRRVSRDQPARRTAGALRGRSRRTRPAPSPTTRTSSRASTGSRRCSTRRRCSSRRDSPPASPGRRSRCATSPARSPRSSPTIR